jgi:hypothetical protein
MKKSDMLVIIAKEASKRSTTHYLYDPYEHAEEILFAIQKAGMLPPLSEEFMRNHPLSTTDAVLDTVVQDFKWDRENEEEEETERE